MLQHFPNWDMLLYAQAGNGDLLRKTEILWWNQMCIRDRVVGETRQIINEKIETEMEIRTLLTANRNDLNIMILMPVILMLMLGGMGDMSIVQNTPVNVVIKLTALALFGGAYYMGRKIVDIRI